MGSNEEMVVVENVDQPSLKMKEDTNHNNENGFDKALEAEGSGRKESVDGESEEDDRGGWTGKLDFLMSALSFAVGMGNIWRFPYLAYRNGGGAFLIPYILMVIFAGFPMMFLEFAFGQYASQGVVSIWKASPIFQGIGWTMFSISFISSIYYNMLVAYSFYYTFASLNKDVPWRTCDNWWNTDACGGMNKTLSMKTCKTDGGLWFNNTCLPSANITEDLRYNIMSSQNNSMDVAFTGKARSPADEYFHNNMLDISEGIHDLGMVKWQLALCLLLCWVIVFVCLWKGIKSQGKVTYVTSVFPFILLIILLIRGVTLEGSAQGIMYYITPQWHRLASAKVWGDAAVQVFFSMSTCWGGLITLASYNKFNNNCLRDSIVVAIGDTLTAIFAGFVIFAILGYMAHTLNVHIEDVATQGAGLAFIVYPSAVTSLPISPLWSILFMLMLLNLGFGTQFTLVTTSHTTLLDVFPQHLRKGRRPLLLLAVICLFCYIMGLMITTRGGMYVLQIMDTYAPSYGLLVAGLCEVLAISYVYGINKFFKDIEQMLGSKPNIFWKICWMGVTPAIIVLILLFTVIDFKRSTYGDYQYPIIADVFGLCITAAEVGCIPAVALYKIFTTDKEGSIIEKVRYLCQPAEDWGPAAEVKQRFELQEVKVPLKSNDSGDMKEMTAINTDSSYANA